MLYENEIESYKSSLLTHHVRDLTMMVYYLWHQII